MISDLEKKIGYTFQEPALLERALTHASLQRDAGDNERLEFLGDRVLGLAIAGLLYRAFDAEDEGDLAKRHTALVQQAALVDVARALGLPALVKTGGAAGEASVAADAMEALIGAVFLDGGFEAAEKMISALWHDLLLRDPAPPEDPKTELQEWLQERKMPLPVYVLADKSGPAHAPQFRITLEIDGVGAVEAAAASKRAAEKEAARRMLQKIREAS